MIKPIFRLSSSLLGVAFLLLGISAAAAPSPIAFPQIMQGISPQNRATLVGNTSRYLTSGRDMGVLANAENLDNMLLQLQRSVEALAGLLLHKQNFRRLIEQQDLIEETGEMSSETGGRPAKLFRFRPAVLAERAIAGTKLPLSRS